MKVRFSHWEWCALLLLVAVAYANSIPNGFVWDDNMLIVHNYQIRSIKHFPKLFSQDFFACVDRILKYGYYRPFISVSYYLDACAWNGAPWGYHLTNVFLHLMGTFLVFLFFRRTLSGNKYFPFLGAAIFAVHPIHTESVSWISGRTDLIATFFMLGSLLLLMKALERPNGSLFVLSYILFVFALFSKESAYIFPVQAAVVITFFSGKNISWRIRKSLVMGYFILLFLFLYFRFFIIRVATSKTVYFPWHIKLMSMASTFALYMKKFFFPYHLTAYITNPPVASLKDFRFWLGCFIVFFVTGWFVKALRKRQRDVIFWILFTLVSFIPIMNFVVILGPPDMGFPASERFLYLPSMGLIALVLLLVQRWRVDIRVGAACFVFVVCMFLWGTISRNSVWKNDKTLFKNAIESAPEAPLLWNNLGNYLLRHYRFSEAELCFNKAISLQGRTAELLTNLGVVKREMELFDDAVKLFNEALKISERARIHFNLGKTYLKMEDYDAAITHVARAHQLDSENIEIMSFLAELYKRRKNFDKALFLYKKAVELFPASSALWSNLGVVYKMSGEYEKAIAAFRHAIQIDENNSAAHEGLGVILADQGHLEAAEKELRIACLANSYNLSAANALGIVLFKEKKTSEARKHFQTLIEQFPQSAEAYINLGILTYLEGDRRAARTWFLKAMELAPGDSRVKGFLSRLQQEIQKK